MAIYKLKSFARFSRREGIDDKSLTAAIERAERGLVDADLGGGLIKQRVARKGQGRSGGYRMMIAFRAGELAIFLTGFAKSDQGNVDDAQLATLHRIAASWLASDAALIQKFVTAGELVEVEE